MYSPNDTAEAVGCPIRKSSDQSLLAAPQGLTQPVTSFIASQCQGIHQMPFRHLITLNHTQGAKDRCQRSEVRYQIFDDPTNPGQCPTTRVCKLCASQWHGDMNRQMFKLWRGLITKASTEHRQYNYQATERYAHAIVRRLVSKENITPHPKKTGRTVCVFFTSSSQYQRTQTSIQRSDLKTARCSDI